jgi:hypothetical protein
MMNKNTETDSLEPGNTIEESKSSPQKSTIYLIMIAVLLVISLYLFINRGGNNSYSQQNLNLEGDVYITPILYNGTIPEPNLKPKFKALFLENVTEIRRVNYLRDLMDVETEGRFENKVVDKASVLYIQDSVETGLVVEHSIYEMESSKGAVQVLNYYITEKKWNTEPKNYRNLTFWLWRGYKENARLPANMEIYWDLNESGAFLPINKRGTYYITRSNAELFDLQGVAVIENYFILVDVHAPIGLLNDLSDYFFEEVAAKITLK